MAGLEVQIISPAKVVFSDSAVQVNAPGSLGQLGILPGHTAMVSELVAGVVTLDKAGEPSVTFKVTGGYLEVEQDKVLILADSAEPG